MNEQFKILDAGIQFGYPTHNIFEPWNIKLVDSLKAKPDLVLFGGGEDINPAIYHHKSVIGPFPEHATEREQAEATLFLLCVERRIPMFGVCRGLQFLNVMFEGWLIQHLPFHAGKDHPITFYIPGEFPQITVNSCHHQSCIPNPNRSYVIATAKNGCSSVDIEYDKEAINLKPPFDELSVEAMGFGKKALGVQWHPEYVKTNHPMSRMTRKLVDKILFNSLMEKENAVSV